MEDIALRREIEEKKKREGTWQEPKLTPKQKEAKTAQLEKESLVRNRVKNTNAFLTPRLILLQASIKGNLKSTLIYQKNYTIGSKTNHLFAFL